MQQTVLLAFLLPFVLASADESPSYPSTEPKYDYTWQVSDEYSNLNFGQKEARDGGSTVGSYFVLLPDGRTQKVAYTVDAYGGYQATVTYEGEAKPYEAKPYEPTYKAQASNYKPVQRSYKLTPKAAEKKDDLKEGEVYYKPVEDAPEPKVYYKPLPEEKVGQVYYKPIDA